jgi:hypothetical protein
LKGERTRASSLEKAFEESKPAAGRVKQTRPQFHPSTVARLVNGKFASKMRDFSGSREGQFQKKK